MSKILDLVTGILPGKNKDNGYYLELKEDEVKSPATSKVAKSQPESSNGVAPVKPTAETSVAPDTSASNGNTAEKKEAEPKSKKVSIKERRKAEKAKKSQSENSPQTTSTAPARTVKPQEPVETNFSTKYLMPNSTNGRRRPGANMNSFLEMARTVKTPIVK
ncbi:hypothetical protein [Mastigocoleus testarum]|uniref:Uncharacterized protein n=1 Tax=Mastigocoleus testarum BC008 TaxID=371196 RepID=A0A0V7ZEM5_9CYAN|nr:hypothetical protein [Mastigocoleus testarum]KST62955.1 hypothetical protein BC008_11605 [Mastigocoleus testarum BC008]KST63046.1 hypothetical protein BC008_12080 [Mastigocoleus testarum BC008]